MTLPIRDPTALPAHAVHITIAGLSRCVLPAREPDVENAWVTERDKA